MMTSGQATTTPRAPMMSHIGCTDCRDTPRYPCRRCEYWLWAAFNAAGAIARALTAAVAPRGGERG